MRGRATIAAASLAFLAGAAQAAGDPPCRIGSFPPGFPPLDPWMVFFDWNDVTIEPQAAMILDNVASAWRGLPQSQCPIEIVGHADRSGPADYNLALSKRRAEAIAAYLRRRGVNSDIRTTGDGETWLLVDTPDGVREPQNRGAHVLIVPNP